MSVVSIYIHWPFCLSKCPYCDFNSHVRSSVNHREWLKSLVLELHSYREYLLNKTVSSIFFGGGTPTLADPYVIAGVIEAIYGICKVLDNVEITVEANPTSVESRKFKEIASAGVNRVSVGVQSLQKDNLIFLGREHSVHDAKRAIDCARQHFSRYSFDMIYGLPGQDLLSWLEELSDAIKLSDGHMSLYQLTIEKGTRFFSLHRDGAFTMPKEETLAQMYEHTEKIMQANGYSCYEISNYARPGNESRHNMQYWKCGDYLGIGPGAHGRVTESSKKYAVSNISNPENWLSKVQECGSGVQIKQKLSEVEILEEKIMMGLRLTSGLDNLPANVISKAQYMLDAGLLTFNGKTLKTTLSGRLVLNSIIKELCNFG